MDFATDLRVFVRETASPQARAQVAADFARAELAKAKEHNRMILGRVPPVTTIVDGKSGAALESVNTNRGEITFSFGFDVRPLIVRDAIVALIKASPRRSGDYINNHRLYLNGVEVGSLPETLKPGDRVALSNPVPYARRLEIGKTKAGRSFVLQVPDRIYERVAKRVLIPKYRGEANISFGYWDLPNAHVTTGGLSPFYLTGVARKQTQKHGSLVYRAGEIKIRQRRQKPGTKVRAPAIFIEAA